MVADRAGGAGGRGEGDREGYASESAGGRASCEAEEKVDHGATVGGLAGAANVVGLPDPLVDEA